MTNSKEASAIECSSTQTKSFARARRIATRWLLAVAIGSVTACATRPNPETEHSISLATGLENAVVLKIEGGPIDEPTPAGNRLTLADAVQRTMACDPGLQAALARVHVAMAEADQARLLPNPVLNIAIRFPETGGTAVIEASLAQDVISILMLPRKSSAADNRLRQAAADAVTVALDVAAEVQERYATVQSLDELIPVLQQRRELLAKLVGLAQARLDAHEGTRDDVVTLQTQLVEAEVEIAERELDQRDERLRLARLIGEPSSAATWTVDRWTSPEGLSASETTWVETALQNRPEIQSIAWQLGALEDDQALTRLLPFEGTEAGVSAEREGSWDVGPAFAVPIPIFDMGQARSARVTAEQIEARHNLTLAKRQVVEDVRRAIESLTRSQSNLQRVRGELIPLLQQRRGLAENSFRNGFSDVTALFLAEQDLRAADVNQVELELQTTIALVRLHRAVGGAGIANRMNQSPTNPVDVAGAQQAVAVSDNALTVRLKEVSQ